MRLTSAIRLSTISILILGLTVAAGMHEAGSLFPITVTDASGKAIKLKASAKRIVSLVPSATQALFGIGAGDLIVGLTCYDTYPKEAYTKPIVGSFRSFSPELIEKLKPDVILFSRIRHKIRDKSAGSGIALVEVNTHTVEDAFKMTELIGRITDRNKEAAAKISHIREQLDLVSRKVAKIPVQKPKRVIRLMGFDEVMASGDDSFQNELIRYAGGIPPVFKKSGAVVPVTKKEGGKFSPQFIYYCGSEWRLSKKLFDKPGWKDVDAVKNANHAQFPIDLTCRASTHMGDFVSWLASVIYPDELISETTRLSLDQLLRRRSLTVDLPYMRSAQVIYGKVHDFPAQTICIDFTEPMNCLSSLTGTASGITTVGNHYVPLSLSGKFHGLTFNALREKVCSIIQREAPKCSFLYTGVKMDNLSVQRTQHKKIIGYALATADVLSNAMRAGIDEGIFYKPGTINITVLTKESPSIYVDLLQLLLNPSHAGFLESAFAIGTAYDAGLVSNLLSFQETYKRKCKKISGSTIEKLTQFLPHDCASRPICMALNALLNGLYHRNKQSSKASPAPNRRAK